VGWELLRPGGDEEAGAGGFRGHGAGGIGALQHGGGDQEVWGGAGEERGNPVIDAQQCYLLSASILRNNGSIAGRSSETAFHTTTRFTPK
jgi:hypothetical protein